MPVEFREAAEAVSPSEWSEDVVLLDNCEDTYKWTNSGTGADFGGSYSAQINYFGTKLHKLLTKTTTPAEDDYVTALRKLCLPVERSLELRFRMCPENITKTKTITLLLGIHNGTRHYKASLVWTPGTPKVEYTNSAGTLVELTDLAIQPLPVTWYNVGLKFDASAMT